VQQGSLPAAGNEEPILTATWMEALLPFGDHVTVVERCVRTKLFRGALVNRLRPHAALVMATGAWGVEITVAEIRGGRHPGDRCSVDDRIRARSLA